MCSGRSTVLELRHDAVQQGERAVSYACVQGSIISPLFQFDTDYYSCFRVWPRLLLFPSVVRCTSVARSHAIQPAVLSARPKCFSVLFDTHNATPTSSTRGEPRTRTPPNGRPARPVASVPAAANAPRHHPHRAASAAIGRGGGGRSRRRRRRRRRPKTAESARRTQPPPLTTRPRRRRRPRCARGR